MAGNGPGNVGEDLFPLVRLGHRLRGRSWEEGDYDNGTAVAGVDFYSLHPVGIRQPSSGRVKALVRCGECGELLRCTVYSVRGAPWLRRRALVRACAAIGCVAGAWCLVGLAFAWHPGLGTESPVVLGAVVLGFASLCALVGAAVVIVGRRDDTGVRLHGGGKAHALRPPGGEVHEWRRAGKPPGGYW
jgi:hypothetical protein